MVESGGSEVSEYAVLFMLVLVADLVEMKAKKKKVELLDS